MKHVSPTLAETTELGQELVAISMESNDNAVKSKKKLSLKERKKLAADRYFNDPQNSAVVVETIFRAPKTWANLHEHDDLPQIDRVPTAVGYHSMDSMDDNVVDRSRYDRYKPPRRSTKKEGRDPPDEKQAQTPTNVFPEEEPIGFDRYGGLDIPMFSQDDTVDTAPPVWKSFSEAEEPKEPNKEWVQLQKVRAERVRELNHVHVPAFLLRSGADRRHPQEIVFNDQLPSVLPSVQVEEREELDEKQKTGWSAIRSFISGGGGGGKEMKKGMGDIDGMTKKKSSSFDRSLPSRNAASDASKAQKKQRGQKSSYLEGKERLPGSANFEKKTRPSRASLPVGVSEREDCDAVPYPREERKQKNSRTSSKESKREVTETKRLSISSRSEVRGKHEKERVVARRPSKSQKAPLKSTSRARKVDMNKIQSKMSTTSSMSKSDGSYSTYTKIKRFAAKRRAKTSDQPTGDKETKADESSVIEVEFQTADDASRRGSITDAPGVIEAPVKRNPEPNEQQNCVPTGFGNLCRCDNKTETSSRSASARKEEPEKKDDGAKESSSRGTKPMKKMRGGVAPTPNRAKKGGKVKAPPLNLEVIEVEEDANDENDNPHDKRNKTNRLGPEGSQKRTPHNMSISTIEIPTPKFKGEDDESVSILGLVRSHRSSSSALKKSSSNEASTKKKIITSPRKKGGFFKFRSKAQ